MPKFGLDIDATPFLRGLARAEAAFLRAAERGMATAGMQLLNDAIMEPPTVPIETGTLRSSGSVFVQGRLVGITPPTGPAPAPTPARDDPIQAPPGQLRVRVGFNTPYAARWHEIPAHFREPSAGNKYLEAKMAAHADDYAAVVAEVIMQWIEHRR